MDTDNTEFVTDILEFLTDKRGFPTDISDLATDKRGLLRILWP